MLWDKLKLSTVSIIFIETILLCIFSAHIGISYMWKDTQREKLVNVIDIKFSTFFSIAIREHL